LPVLVPRAAVGWLVVPLMCRATRVAMRPLAPSEHRARRGSRPVAIIRGRAAQRAAVRVRSRRWRSRPRAPPLARRRLGRARQPPPLGGEWQRMPAKGELLGRNPLLGAGMALLASAASATLQSVAFCDCHVVRAQRLAPPRVGQLRRPRSQDLMLHQHKHSRSLIHSVRRMNVM
jgi:hypothetical protein